MNLQARLLKIKQNWLTIIAKESEDQTSGAANHGSMLKPVLSQNDLEVFEQNHGIELPEEFKSYLKEVGNGGIGIQGEMYSLDESLTPLFKDLKNENFIEHYKKPFILTEEKIIEYLTQRIKIAHSEGAPIKMNYTDGGYLFLSSISEDKHYILVLNGACKEEVFELNNVQTTLENGDLDQFLEIRPIVRFKDDQIKTLSFLDWIEDEQENWFNANKELDRKLSGLKTMWYSFNHWDKNREVFGAFMHHYELKNLLSESEVTDFENKYQCILPLEYRNYLKLVTNGGVGPFYGMYSLENATIALNSGSINDGDFVNHLEKNPSHFSKEFPITEHQIETYIRQRINQPDEPSIPIKLPKNAGGYLFISEYGCGGYYILPVNGIVAGQIWYLQKLDANKLTFEMTDQEGNVTMSGSYGDDSDEDYFEIYPELIVEGKSILTATFLEWMRWKQIRWFDELLQNKPISGDANLNNENAYFPLAVGNTWKYNYSGTEMITTIEDCDEHGVFILSNSLSPLKSCMKKVNGEYLSDSYEAGNFQMILKENLQLSDTWEAKFMANGIECVYNFTVKEILSSLVVDGKEFKEVALVESASNMMMHGNLISMNSFVQSYYAKGVGLILITTSGVVGNTSSPLISFELR